MRFWRRPILLLIAAALSVGGAAFCAEEEPQEVEIEGGIDKLKEILDAVPDAVEARDSYHRSLLHRRSQT